MHNEVEAQIFSFLICGKEDLFPRFVNLSSNYWKAYQNLVNDTFSGIDDFLNLRDGFLQYSSANTPVDGQKEGLYSKLNTPTGEGNTFLLSKYFK